MALEKTATVGVRSTRMPGRIKAVCSTGSLDALCAAGGLAQVRIVVERTAGAGAPVPSVGALATPTEAEGRARAMSHQEAEPSSSSVSTTLAHCALAGGRGNHRQKNVAAGGGSAAAPHCPRPQEARGCSPMKPPMVPASSSSAASKAGTGGGCRRGGAGAGSDGGDGGGGGEFSAAGARLSYGYLQPLGGGGLKNSSSCPEVGRLAQHASATDAANAAAAPIWSRRKWRRAPSRLDVRVQPALGVVEVC